MLEQKQRRRRRLPAGGQEAEAAARAFAGAALRRVLRERWTQAKKLLLLDDALLPLLHVKGKGNGDTQWDGWMETPMDV